MISGGHAKLHRRARGRHRQIESMLKLDLLRLRDAESARDVGKRLLREDDRAGPHCSDSADKLNVLDRFGKELQTATVLFQKTQPRAIDLAVDEQAHEPFVTETRSERKFALRDVEGGFSVAEWLVVQTRHVFEGRVAHGRMVTIDVECAHAKLFRRQRRPFQKWPARRRLVAHRRRASHLSQL